MMEGSQSSKELIDQCNCEQPLLQKPNIKSLRLSTSCKVENKLKSELENKWNSLDKKSSNQSIKNNTRLKQEQDGLYINPKISTSQVNNEISKRILQQLEPQEEDGVRIQPLKNENARPIMNHTTQTNSDNPYMKIIFFCFLSVLLVMIYDQFITSPQYNLKKNHFNLTNITVELQEKIHGQDNAIHQLIEHYREYVMGLDVVILIGGSGVGKSYTAKIIKKYYLNKNNILEFRPPLENIHEVAYDSLFTFDCNIIILENLNSNHLSELVNFILFLYNQKYQLHCTTILAILNPEMTDDNLTKTIDLKESIKDIETIFSGVNISATIISFDPLTSDIIDACIKDEAKKSDIRLTDDQVTQIKKQLLLTNSGCKRAHAKVQLYANT